MTRVGRQKESGLRFPIMYIQYMLMKESQAFAITIDRESVCVCGIFDVI